jgi:hypothetical protein
MPSRRCPEALEALGGLGGLGPRLLAGRQLRGGGTSRVRPRVNARAASFSKDVAPLPTWHASSGSASTAGTTRPATLSGRSDRHSGANTPVQNAASAPPLLPATPSSPHLPAVSKPPPAVAHRLLPLLHRTGKSSVTASQGRHCSSALPTHFVSHNGPSTSLPTNQPMSYRPFTHNLIQDPQLSDPSTPPSSTSTFLPLPPPNLRPASRITHSHLTHRFLLTSTIMPFPSPATLQQQVSILRPTLVVAPVGHQTRTLLRIRTLSPTFSKWPRRNPLSSRTALTPPRTYPTRDHSFIHGSQISPGYTRYSAPSFVPLTSLSKLRDR